MRQIIGISLLALVACSPAHEQEASVRVLSAAGEWPSMSELTAPQGAALRAENVVVDTQDEYTTHRGLEKGTPGDRIWSSITVYAGSVIAHSEEEGTLARRTGGAWEEYVGTYNAPPGEVMAFQEHSGALFFTSSVGIYRLDGPTATPVLSGLSQGLPGTATLTGSSGYLTEGFTTAYRHSWALNVDAEGNERLIESAPSPRLLVNNPTATAASRDVEVTWPIPEDLPEGAYNRTFRADAVPETISPTDEVRQVYERAPTEAELAAGSFVFTDSTPDTVKGAGAYFSANTGEGLAQSNYRPPLARSLATFADSLFGLAVDGVQSITINLLGASALAGGNGLVFTRNGISESYAASNAEAFPDVFEVFTSGTPQQNTANTINSLCRAINSRPGGYLYAFPLDTDGTNPGGFLVTARDVVQDVISVEAIYDAAPFVPRMNATLAISSAFRLAGVVTVNFGGDHGLGVDDQVDLLDEYGVPSDAVLFPPGVKTISAVPAPNQIEYIEAGPDGNNAGSFSYKTVGFDVVSTSGTAQNAYAWTKQGEPDHWPLANLATAGGATDTLWWGAPLDRFLFLGSDAGLFRLQGNARTGFGLMDAGVWDSTVSFLGRRNVAVIDGQGYAVAREGLVTWSEGQKPDAVDIPIQDEIRALVAAIPDLVAELGFMVADQSNHRLYVCLPQEASDTAATRCHVLSTRTGAWTRLTDTFPGFEEGFVAGFSPNAGTGVAHFITPEASALQGYVLSTRATYTDADYQGPDGEAIPAKVTYLPMVAGEPGRFKDWTWTRVFTKDPNADEDTTKLQVCFATEMLPAETCKLLPDVDPVYTGWEPVADPVRGIAWKTIVDMFHQRGKGLTVAVGRSVAQQPLRLMGLEVKHRAYGSGQ